MADDELVPSWLPDYILGVLRSPTWALPIAAFKDENCEMFEDVNEFTFDHTACHGRFKQLVVDLFEAHLAEVLITPEQFDSFCESGFEQHQQVHRTLAESLLAVDDFLIFNAMMAMHAADINAEVVAFDAESGVPFNMESMADDVVASTIAEGIFTGGGDDWNDADAEEEQLKLALAASENDQESVEARMKREEAAMQQAIAMSLQIEEERVRVAVAEVEATENIEAVAAAEAVAPSVPVDASPGVSAGGPADEVSPIPKYVTIEPAAAAASPQAQPAPAALEPTMHAPSSLPSLQPLRPSPAAVAAEVEQVRALRQRAEQAAMAPASESLPTRKAIAQATAAEAAIAQGRTVPSEEERAARAEHLRRNRDALKRKRAEKRDRELANFQEAKTAQAHAHGIDSAAAGEPEKLAAGRRLVAELTPGAAVAPAGTQGGSTDGQTAHRMHQALTAQLRTSLARSWAPGPGALNAKVSQLENMKGGGGGS